MKNPRTTQPHSQWLAAAGVLLLVAMLVACRAPQTSDAGSNTQALPARQAAKTAPETNGVSEMSALEAVLDVFSGGNGNEWQAYDAVSGVMWRDASPVSSEGARDAAASYKRGGNILLTGFGMADVPNGKTGAGAGSRKDNEGNSGITLFGTADRVESIAVMKFYPSQDYAGILKNQFGPDTAIELMANACGAEQGAEDPEIREFYRVVPPGSTGVYAEIYVDAEGGKYSPGSTTFEFYRSEPTDKIETMGCKVIGKN